MNMSKEMLIVFVYDCERCQKEEDDPQDAIVYFYPSWVSEQQRLALCGQLMGVCQFLNSVFSFPKIVALQIGKFAVKSLGRFTLCVGTDRNIPDLVLDTRIRTLYCLIRVYHKNFENIISHIKNEQITEKLSQIFETYLPIVQFAGNIFGTIPTFILPKSASTVFMESIQILQCFQNKAGIVGGVVLYQNKVVATQLSAGLSKLLVITDPYRIKLPAEGVPTQFRLPVGVQLLTVYIERSELVMLEQEASEMKAALKSTKQRLKNNKNKDSSKTCSTKEVVSGSAVYTMKRDVSRIFTVVEEVEGEMEGERVNNVQDAVAAQETVGQRYVAPACFVVPDQVVEKKAQSTDDLQHCCDNKINVRYCSLGTSASKEDTEERVELLRPYYNTISDSTLPLFRHNGLPASKSLYDTRVGCHYHNLYKQNVTKKNMVPMKELGSKPPSMSIPLTPLMAKLSLLAMEQKGEAGTPAAEKPVPPHRTESLRQKAQENGHPEELDEKVLYVCGYQNMTLLLLMDCESSQDPEQIHSLWQTSVSSLSELEPHLHHCLEHLPSSSAACESYSFLSVDPVWGTTHRCGAWAGARLELLTTMHNHFKNRPQLTEATVRTEDSIIYGTQCGGVQVFYQQGCSEGSSMGLPAPSGPMGLVSLKAKRRLERDHGIVLF